MVESANGRKLGNLINPLISSTNSLSTYPFESASIPSKTV